MVDVEKKRSFKIVLIATLAIAIIGIGLSFASMSTVLDIHGYASMNTANWDVHFENLTQATITGEAIEEEKPVITNKSTSISTFGVKLIAPKDTVSYSFEVKNAGGIEAKLTSVTIPTPTCTGTGITKDEDEKLVCPNLTYTLTYRDGTKLAVGDVLKKGESKKLILKLSYQGSSLPVNEINITNLAIAMIYSQN